MIGYFEQMENKNQVAGRSRTSRAAFEGRPAAGLRPPDGIVSAPPLVGLPRSVFARQRAHDLDTDRRVPGCRCTSAHMRCTTPSPRCGIATSRSATSRRNRSRSATSNGRAAANTMSNSVSVNFSIDCHQQIADRLPYGVGPGERPVFELGIAFDHHGFLPPRSWPFQENPLLPPAPYHGSTVKQTGDIGVLLTRCCNALVSQPGRARGDSFGPASVHGSAHGACCCRISSISSLVIPAPTNGPST
jgi:hypothetical protein